MQRIIGLWFQPKNTLKYLVFSFLCCVLFACSHEEEAPDIFGPIRLTQTSFSTLEGWKNDDFAQVIPVFSKNCAKILQSTKSYMSETGVRIKTSDYQNICNKFNKQNIDTSAKMQKFLEKEFTPYIVSAGNNQTGKFTSYYEAIINASFEKNDRYKYPVYGKPSDLVEINLRDFGTDLPNTRLVGHVIKGKFVPYHKRAEIENHGIDAPVLMWADDPVDIHFMQIQGSAIAKMDDGSELRIGYADNNGHKFRGIGTIMLEKKILKPGEVSMENIRTWLRTHKKEAKELMQQNERFIFQQISDADGPLGAFGVPLTAGRSMAVDNAFIPLGSLLWLDTVSPDKKPLQKLMFAQDIGAAIKGAVRGDYFWGHGDEALHYAGRMNSVGKYYLLAPKNSKIEVK